MYTKIEYAPKTSSGTSANATIEEGENDTSSKVAYYKCCCGGDECPPVASTGDTLGGFCLITGSIVHPNCLAKDTKGKIIYPAICDTCSDAIASCGNKNILPYNEYIYYHGSTSGLKGDRGIDQGWNSLSSIHTALTRKLKQARLMDTSNIPLIKDIMAITAFSNGMSGFDQL
jgi:hypothetical protein